MDCLLTWLMPMNIDTLTEIRPVLDEELNTCIALDHSAVTERVWQVDVTEAQDEFIYNFRVVRLPRPMNIAYPQDPQAMLLDWQQRDCFLVAVYQAQICGYLNMRVDRACEIGWIRQLVVHRPMRRRRIGSALLNAVQEWSRAQALRRLMIETQTKNYPGIAFCQRNGFGLSGFNDRYYPNQDIAVFFSLGVR